jgi:hypothetical protein
LGGEGITVGAFFFDTGGLGTGVPLSESWGSHTGGISYFNLAQGRTGSYGFSSQFAAGDSNYLEKVIDYPVFDSIAAFYAMQMNFTGYPNTNQSSPLMEFTLDRGAEHITWRLTATARGAIIMTNSYAPTIRYQSPNGIFPRQNQYFGVEFRVDASQPSQMIACIYTPTVSGGGYVFECPIGNTGVTAGGVGGTVTYKLYMWGLNQPWIGINKYDDIVLYRDLSDYGGHTWGDARIYQTRIGSNATVQEWNPPLPANHAALVAEYPGINDLNFITAGSDGSTPRKDTYGMFTVTKQDSAEDAALVLAFRGEGSGAVRGVMLDGGDSIEFNGNVNVPAEYRFLYSVHEGSDLFQYLNGTRPNAKFGVLSVDNNVDVSWLHALGITKTPDMVGTHPQNVLTDFRQQAFMMG